MEAELRKGSKIETPWGPGRVLWIVDYRGAQIVRVKLDGYGKGAGIVQYTLT